MEENSREKVLTAEAELRHNIRGPLTAIILNCELVIEGPCPPVVRKRVETILAEAMQISRQLRGESQNS